MILGWGDGRSLVSGYEEWGNAAETFFDASDVEYLDDPGMRDDRRRMIAEEMARWPEDRRHDVYSSGETPAVGDEVHIVGTPWAHYQVRAVAPADERTRVEIRSLGPSMHVAQAFVLVRRGGGT